MRIDAQTPVDSAGPAEPASKPSGNGQAQPGNPAAQAIHDVPIFVAELKSYAGYLLGAKIDRITAGIRQIAIYGALGIVGLLFVAGVLFTAVFLVLGGLAVGLGQLLGSRLWLGALIVGVATLGIIGFGMSMVIRKTTQSWRLKTEQKYAGKQNEQLGKFGHDVHDRAGRA